MRHMKASIRMIAAGLAIAGVGLVAGCGGSGDDASTQSATAASTGADSAAFVAEANGICTAANEEFVALGNMQEFEDLADFQDRFPKAIAIAEKQYDDIAALEPPATIEAEVTTYLDEGRQSVKMSQELYDKVVAGTDISTAEAETLGTEEGQATIAARREAATAAGLDDCAS